MNTAAKIVVSIGIALGASMFLNPSAEHHRRQITESVAERSPLAGLMGVGALAAFVSNYHSVGVASYTSIRGRLVSVGVLGVVFVIDSQKDL